MENQIEWYTDKYLLKMFGSKLEIAKDWIPDNLNEAEKSQVLKNILAVPGAVSKEG